MARIINHCSSSDMLYTPQRAGIFILSRKLSPKTVELYDDYFLLDNKKIQLDYGHYTNEDGEQGRIQGPFINEKAYEVSFWKWMRFIEREKAGEYDFAERID